MKFNRNIEDRTKALYLFFALAGAIILFFLINERNTILSGINKVVGMFTPFIFGGILAYFLNLLKGLIDRRLICHIKSNSVSPKAKKAISIAITYLLFMLVVGLLLTMLIPQVISAVQGIIEQGRAYVPKSPEKIQELLENFNINSSVIDTLNEKVTEIIGYITNYLSASVPVIAGFATGFVTMTANAVIGFILSVYMLIEKDNLIGIAKKGCYALFPKKAADKIIHIGHTLNHTLRAYFGALLFVAALVGILFFIGLTILGVKYAIVMAIILGITNMIPWVGPWIGSFPVFLMILMQDPFKALWFIGLVILVQQIDNNLITPKVQSDTMGLSAFWILLAVIVGGSLLGLVGMFIGVPLFVVFYGLVKEFIEYLLRKKSLPIETEEYISKEEEDKQN